MIALGAQGATEDSMHGSARRWAVAASIVCVTLSSVAMARQSEPTISPEARAVAQAVTAAELAAWGRERGDAQALIIAARMLAEIPMRDHQPTVATERPQVARDRRAAPVQPAPVTPAAPPMPSAPPPPPPPPAPAPVVVQPPAARAEATVISTEQLLDEASALPGGAEAVVVTGSRIRTGVEDSPFGAGPLSTVKQLRARERWAFEVDARGGEMLRVAAIGDGDTNIDLSVLDAAGTLLCRDGQGDHYPVCNVAPRRAGKVRVVITNLGSVWTRVQVLSN